MITRISLNNFVYIYKNANHIKPAHEKTWCRLAHYFPTHFSYIQINNTQNFCQ